MEAYSLALIVNFFQGLVSGNFVSCLGNLDSRLGRSDSCRVWKPSYERLLFMGPRGILGILNIFLSF